MKSFLLTLFFFISVTRVMYWNNQEYHDPVSLNPHAIVYMIAPHRQDQITPRHQTTIYLMNGTQLAVKETIGYIEQLLYSN